MEKEIKDFIEEHLPLVKNYRRIETKFITPVLNTKFKVLVGYDYILVEDKPLGCFPDDDMWIEMLKKEWLARFPKKMLLKRD